MHNSTFPAMSQCDHQKFSHLKKKPRKYLRHNYNCTSYMKFGKRYCPSHYIKMQDMDAIVLEDIRSLAQLVVEDEEKAKAEFLALKAKHHEEQYSVDTKKLTEGKFRLQELADKWEVEQLPRQPE